MRTTVSMLWLSAGKSKGLADAGATIPFLLCLTSENKSGDIKHKYWNIAIPLDIVRNYYFVMSHNSFVYMYTSSNKST